MRSSTIKLLALLKSLIWWKSGLFGKLGPFKEFGNISIDQLLPSLDVGHGESMHTIGYKSNVWLAPSFGEIKFNIDASALGKLGLTMVGGVLRNAQGFMKCMFSTIVGVMDLNQAELLAINEPSLSWLLTTGLGTILLLWKVTPLWLGWIKNNSILWRLNSVANSIVNGCGQVESGPFHPHQPWEEFLADSLARQTEQKGRSFPWLALICSSPCLLCFRVVCCWFCWLSAALSVLCSCSVVLLFSCASCAFGCSVSLWCLGLSPPFVWPHFTGFSMLLGFLVFLADLFGSLGSLFFCYFPCI